ncbi:hypothetical protein HT576_22575 [Haloterrigena sp. SYSU A121-1]|uniref:Uncharacterized protein n=1 Tax=Haloterrigena gelatinilytica TaxID=2741724 RepID=A0A8J8KJT8_9EURY|nr:hypothetical protein [Haloterrigena gelatinilytica]NUB93764.1 hypothetical protein [Haloterrigena gelatinilytica]
MTTESTGTNESVEPQVIVVGRAGGRSGLTGGLTEAGDLLLEAANQSEE